MDLPAGGGADCRHGDAGRGTRSFTAVGSRPQRLQPRGGHSGAVQYDHGKARDGQFQRTGALAPPPAVLLNAAQALAVQRARTADDPVLSNVKRINTSLRSLRRFRFPGVGNDHLYQPQCDHRQPGASCERAECDPSQRIPRPEEDDGTFVIMHRGTIASGELVVKTAGLRDMLAQQYGLLCFEMEAAGALGDFPCMIVRGVSDYCDSHKNDQWHGYAAAVAAAYARQLFFHMPIHEVQHSSSSTEGRPNSNDGIGAAIPGNKGPTPRRETPRDSLVEVVKQSSANTEDITTIVTSKDTWVPMHAASRHGHLEVVRLLLENGVSASIPDDYNRTPIYQASQHGHLEVVKLLLESGAIARAPNKEGWTPVYQASRNGHIDVVKLLLENGATATDMTYKGGWTPIHAASNNGHTEIVKLLLENGANASTVANVNGHTPMYEASRNGNTKLVELLLKYGASGTKVSTQLGWAPIHVATDNGHTEVVKLLVGNGSNANTVRNKEGWTPIHLASKRGHVKLVKFLLESGANVNDTNNDGWTPIYLASRRGHTEVVKLLLGNRADAAVANDGGWTALHTASTEGHVDVVRLLLENGASVDIRSGDGWVPIHSASMNGHVQVVKLLLERGVSPTTASNNGQTPIYVASANGHLNLVKLLLDSGNKAIR
ncbi:hypothetical protein CSUB01_04081 [Colletotrichum sublineola]|uniref:Uncharacterized protein n=1 Tax=Colletotrichum sublineola TaxID=1173701 RepID=A0A066WUZ1_COLSU|nr:hypothetical protein CSUB01_04081 [Colletotrichum sublineola]